MKRAVENVRASRIEQAKQYTRKAMWTIWNRQCERNNFPTYEPKERNEYTQQHIGKTLP